MGSDRESQDTSKLHNRLSWQEFMRRPLYTFFFHPAKCLHATMRILQMSEMHSKSDRANLGTLETREPINAKKMLLFSVLADRCKV